MKISFAAAALIAACLSLPPSSHAQTAPVEGVGKMEINAEGKFTLGGRTPQECGVMLGGVGAGFLELWPDGCIHDWSIFNRGRWGYRGDHWPQDKQDRMPLTDMNADAMQFYVWTRSTGAAAGTKPVARRLSQVGTQMNPYSANNWMQNVEGIDYDSSFPGATLRYRDDALPVQVSSQFFSPIIPHELKISGTPGAYMVFTFRNTSDKPQDVSLATYLRNPLGRGGDASNRGAAVRNLHTSIIPDMASGTTYLTMRTDADLPFKTTTGTLCLSMNGGTATYIASDFGEFLLGRTLSIKPWNQRFECALNDFRKTGRLPNTEEQPCPTKLGPLTIGGGKAPSTQELPKDAVTSGSKAEIDALTDEQIAGIIAQAQALPSLRAILDEARAVDPNLLIPAKGGRTMVDYLRQAVSQMAGEDGRAINWGDAMLCSSLTLKPGEEKQVRVILSWNFPNHPSPNKDRNMGHMYSNWFKDAAETNRYLGEHYEEFRGRVSTFRDALQNNTLPLDLRIAVSSQLNTLICSSWWTQDGKMGMWEGLGTIGQNTVDVSYQGSHPICTLFPEWEKTWTALATTYQNETTGRLYHSLPGDMDKGGRGNGYGYIDVNCHFALEMTRDYLWFGDKAYLDFYYPHLVKELGVFEALDSDGDGLPDQHMASNTYDTWDLQGTPSYMCSIYIGALRGGIRLAEDAGDKANATKWKGILQKAVASLEAKLWNGEYYNLWVEGKEFDDACMTDQLSGEMYSKLIGLGNSVPQERVRKALASIYKYNYDPDQGLYNGTYPPGRHPRMPTYRNVQAEGSNWTGIEYATAASMIDQGMVEEGLNVVKSVNRRYLRAGRFFNHEECGPHYYRPLSIWATLLATTGVKVDAPHGVLTITPPLKQAELRAPWFTATALGQYVRKDGGFEMVCQDGTASFSELRVNVSGVTTAQLDGGSVPCTATTAEGLTVLRFSRPVLLKKGQKLVLH